MSGEPILTWPAIPELWVPACARTRLLVARHRPGQWQACFPEFAIASMGDTKGEAIRDTCEMLVGYLQWCHADGETYAQARRPTRYVRRYLTCRYRLSLSVGWIIDTYGGRETAHLTMPEEPS